MKFMMTGLEPRGEWQQLEAEEMNRRVRHHQQRLDELVMTRLQSGPPGLIFATFGLSEEREVATVKRDRGRHACVDGPFPETKEVVGGFDIVEFASRHDAIAWSTAVPRHPSHVAEIRPIREFWWISGGVDRARLRRFERWSQASEGAHQEHSAAASMYMLTSVADERAVLRRSGRERKELEAEQQLVVAEYVRQRSMQTHEPGMWVGARLGQTGETTTIRWTGGPVVADGPCTETTEMITGFNVVACASQDEAVGWAQKLAAGDGDAIEVRPVRACWWIYHE